MRKVLVGVVLAAGLAGCSGGGGDSVAISADEAAFYTEYCRHYVTCADYPVSQSDCEEYFSELGTASLISDLEWASSCMYDAATCDAAAECLPDDVAARCSSATVIERCRGGACIVEDCRNWCGFNGYTGGTCVSYPDVDDCDCDQAYSKG